MSLQSLDDGLLGQVLGRLPAPSLCAVNQCSRRLRRLTSEDQGLWRDVFRRDFPPYFSAQQAVLAGTGWDWRGTYRRRLQHNQNWKQGQLATPAELLRSHTGPVFSTAFLGPPFQGSGLALSGGVVGNEERAELTLWDIGRGQYEGVGRLGWQLSPDCMANLKGIFHVQQLPGTAKVVLCGFGSECNIASIEALSDVEPLDTTNTLQLLQSLQQTAQAAQAQQQQAQQQQQQHFMPPPQQAQQAQAPQQAQHVQQSLQQGPQAQQGEEQGGHPPSNGPSSSASCAASRPPAGSPSPRAQDIAPRVAAGGVDGQLTYQMMSERMSDLYNWVLRESSNLKYSAVSREQLPPATAGYGLRTDWVLRGHKGAVDLSSCQGNCIATVSFDGTAKLWRVPDERPPAGSETASVGPGQEPVPVLSAAATYVDPPEPGTTAPPLCCVALAADCSQLASGGNDNQVKLWDAERAVLTRRLLGHDGWVWHVMPLVQDDFSALVTGSTDGTVRFWDSRQGGGQVGSVHIDASSPDNVVPVGGLCPRLDGRYLVVGSFDGDMHILDRRQEKVLHSFEAHSDRVTRLSCQGDTILSCSFDGNCRLWQF